MSDKIRLEALRALPTRRLLSLLDSCRIDDKQVERIHLDRAELGEPWMYEWTKQWFQAQMPGDMGFTAAEIKEVLATREHVPNKQEAKAIRRAKHKAGRQRGRRDR